MSLSWLVLWYTATEKSRSRHMCVYVWPRRLERAECTQVCLCVCVCVHLSPCVGVCVSHAEERTLWLMGASFLLLRCGRGQDHAESSHWSRSSLLLFACRLFNLLHFKIINGGWNSPMPFVCVERVLCIWPLLYWYGVLINLDVNIIHGRYFCIQRKPLCYSRQYFPMLLDFLGWYFGEAFRFCRSGIGLQFSFLLCLVWFWHPANIVLIEWFKNHLLGMERRLSD